MLSPGFYPKQFGQTFSKCRHQFIITSTFALIDIVLNQFLLHKYFLLLIQKVSQKQAYEVPYPMVSSCDRSGACLFNISSSISEGLLVSEKYFEQLFFTSLLTILSVSFKTFAQYLFCSYFFLKKFLFERDDVKRMTHLDN